jgi:hypothetical protein
VVNAVGREIVRTAGTLARSVTVRRQRVETVSKLSRQGVPVGRASKPAGGLEMASTHQHEPNLGLKTTLYSIGEPFVLYNTLESRTSGLTMKD